MKSIIVALFVPLLLLAQERKQFGSIVTEDIPPVPEQIVERMNQYQNVRSAGFSDWDPRGTGMLIVTRFGETSQLHYVERPGGARRQVTFFREPVGGGAFYPGNDRQMFLFSRDSGGNEFYQLYTFDMNTGNSEMLTDGASRNGNGRWSSSGRHFSYTSTKRNKRDFDIYVAPVADPKNARLLLEVSGSWAVADWSPDDTQLLVANYVSVTESYLYVVNAATGARRQVNPGMKISYGGAAFRMDGKGVLYTSDEFSEFKQLIAYELQDGTKTVLTGHIPWDVSSFELSNDGKLVAFVTNEGGVSKLRLLDLKSRKEVAIEQPPTGVIGGLEFRKDDSQLAATINTSQSPGDVYALDMKTKKWVRWTSSEVGGLNTAGFAAPTLVEFPTFDKVDGKPRMIPAFYYTPPQGSKPAPVIISIHGGPEGQSRPTFSSVYQYWVNELGVAVLVPNVRGSTGYGKSYVSLDNGFKREESVKDIGALLDWVAQQPELDAKRVAVYGGSYGGYMILASMFHYNDRLACGVDVVGISNFVTFLESTQEYRRDLRRVEYGDERDPAMRNFLQTISPTTNAHKITRPLFVAQGKNDPRVPYTEAEQIVATVRKNGNRVWYMMALDEGHGFAKKANRDYFNNAMTLFWEKHLLR